MKPLFIPLCREPFEQFAAREKTIEFRQYGPRWNEKTCTVGRPVVLSLGYGKKNRIVGFVKSFTKAPILKSRCGVLFWHYFGTDAIGPVAEIEIELEPDRSKPPCLECGAMTPEEAETKCICAGDKDHCHGCDLWP